MIPIHLSLSGFLSYREPVDLDFNHFDVACISGANGAGKSSLLDAITWVLFGQARKRDDSLIHANSETADVSFTFGYEGNVYRVQRIKPRGKTTLLEFHIQGPNGRWKALTERTLRNTETRIESTLRLDYETFVNASFFLQGKADQFTQQRPGDRKRILSSILGLEVWESYRKGSFERRRVLEGQITELDGRLQEINAELAEEETRKKRLKELEGGLKNLSAARAAQETSLEEMRRRAASLAEQEKLVSALAGQLERLTVGQAELGERQNARLAEMQTHQNVANRAKEIEAAYQVWQDTRAELAVWEEVAAR
ncbi:MAG: SMC family ATPase, partial [Anaerolineae bacterium]|nr:SMC family ATPase [Anaerolineae bacterium]